MIGIRIAEMAGRSLHSFAPRLLKTAFGNQAHYPRITVVRLSGNLLQEQQE